MANAVLTDVVRVAVEPVKSTGLLVRNLANFVKNAVVDGDFAGHTMLLTS
jgi:hypothetical protein